MQTFSYDVFDTCLVRVDAKPKMLFYRLAAQVLPASSAATPEAVSDLALGRIEAERKTRQASPGQEITLEAIYRTFSELSDQPIDWQHMQETELDLEAGALRPVPTIRRAIAEQRRQGARILFLSDMYLPATFIREQLLRHGFAEPSDPVYVSSETGFKKASGNLFRHVHEVEGIAYSDWTHTGDHPRGDGQVPQKLGVQVQPVTSTQLSRYEQACAELPGQPCRHAARIAGIARLVRLTREADPGHAARARVIGDIIAPALTGFAAWVLDRARRDGVRRLYFVARDGELPLAAARALLAADTEIDIRYLYGSRRAWLLASAREIDRKTLSWVTGPNLARGMRHLLDRLHLASPDLPEQCSRFDLPPPDSEQDLSDAELDRFWSMMESTPCAQWVQEQASRQRSEAKAYLEQEGLLDGTACALVDLGWHARCQAALNGVLRDQLDQPIPGYYFALRRDRPDPAFGGQASGWFEEPLAGQPDEKQTLRLFRNRSLIEQCVAMPSHASTVGYRRGDKGWEPAFAPFTPPPELPEFHTAILAGVQQYAAEMRKYLAEGGDLSVALECIQAMTIQFITDPTAEEAGLFYWLRVTNDPQETSFMPLVTPISAAMAIRLLFSRLPAGPAKPRVRWREGSIAMSPAWLRPFLPHIPGLRGPRG